MKVHFDFLFVASKSIAMIDSVLEKPKRSLQATIPGTVKDGGPSCGTVKPIDGWKVVKQLDDDKELQINREHRS